MEGVLAAAKDTIVATVDAALGCSEGVCQEECERLARYALKLGLVLGELQLCLQANEALRGSKTVFLAVDATASALRQAEQLVTQCAGTRPSSIWPLEDAVEFQGVAAELRSAAAGLAALGGRLPQDVQQDAAHVYRQLMTLCFTEDELSETEEQELERVQQHHSAGSPRHPAAAAAAAAAGAGAAAPPAAPAEQFDRPGEALANAAVARSEQAAAAARRGASPVPPKVSAADAEQRQALQSAAAVAHIAAAEVLSRGEEEEEGGEEAEGRAAQGWKEGQGAAAAEGQLGEAEEEQQLLLRAEMAEEAAEAEATATGALGIVLTHEGETAMSPTARAKGAVPARASSPLPFDPFEMSHGDDRSLGMNTLKELKNFQRGQEHLALVDEEAQQEAQRCLEASADNLSLREQQQRQQQQAGGAADTGAQALAALQQLHEYEAAMGAGEEAEEAAFAEEGGEEAAPQGSAEGVVPPIHKSRSEKVAAAVAANLAELAEGPTGEAAPVAAEHAGLST